MASRKKQPAKRPRRRANTGTIRQRVGRERPYEACFPLGEGRAPRYESFHTEAEAAAWLDQLVEDRDKAERDIAGGSMLTQDYLPIWLDLRRGHVAPRTWAGYKYYCEYACGEGGIGRVRLDKVDVLTAQRMINRLAGDGFKNTAQLKAVLYQAFEYAFDPLSYIKRNPFAKVGVPKIEHRTAIALTKDQRARMLEAAEQDDQTPLYRQQDAPPALSPFWHLCSRLAFRRGEALSLKWSAIDFDNAVVRIATTRGRLGADHIEGETKGKKVRAAPLPADLVELLRSFRAAQMRAALSNGWRWLPSGYVFVDRMGGPLSVDVVLNRWERIKKAAGIDMAMNIHDLRHTTLTIMALDGVPQNVRMQLAGHETKEMAQHYAGHATLDDVRRAVG